MSSTPDVAGELVLEIEAASEQAVEVLVGEIERLQEIALAATRRRVRLRLVAGSRSTCYMHAHAEDNRGDPDS